MHPNPYSHIYPLNVTLEQTHMALDAMLGQLGNAKHDKHAKVPKKEMKRRIQGTEAEDHPIYLHLKAVAGIAEVCNRPAKGGRCTPSVQTSIADKRSILMMSLTFKGMEAEITKCNQSIAALKASLLAARCFFRWLRCLLAVHSGSPPLSVVCQWSFVGLYLLLPEKTTPSFQFSSLTWVATNCI